MFSICLTTFEYFFELAFIFSLHFNFSLYFGDFVMWFCQFDVVTFCLNISIYLSCYAHFKFNYFGNST